MTRPTSFRLAKDLLQRLDEEAGAAEMSVTALVSSLLDEGLKARRFPGIVYRDGPRGRRAAVVGGPDVWEIVRDLKQTPGKGEQRIRYLSGELGIPPQRVRLGVDFYTAFPEEVDERIAADERAAMTLRELIERRDRLISE